MRLTKKAAAAAILAASLFGSYIYASDPAPATKKAAKAKTPPPPTVEDLINVLRQQLQTQIDALKADLAAKDAALRQAQQVATQAQAAAAKAQQAADAQDDCADDGDRAGHQVLGNAGEADGGFPEEQEEGALAFESGADEGVAADFQGGGQEQ